MCPEILQGMHICKIQIGILVLQYTYCILLCSDRRVCTYFRSLSEHGQHFECCAENVSTNARTCIGEVRVVPRLRTAGWPRAAARLILRRDAKWGCGPFWRQRLMSGVPLRYLVCRSMQKRKKKWFRFFFFKSHSSSPCTSSPLMSVKVHGCKAPQYCFSSEVCSFEWRQAYKSPRVKVTYPGKHGTETWDDFLVSLENLRLEEKTEIKKKLLSMSKKCDHDAREPPKRRNRNYKLWIWKEIKDPWIQMFVVVLLVALESKDVRLMCPFKNDLWAPRCPSLPPPAPQKKKLSLQMIVRNCHSDASVWPCCSSRWSDF